MAVKTLTQERRRFPRGAWPSRLAINLLEPRASSVNRVNCSEAGLCLRLEESLEVRSMIRFQLQPGNIGSGKPSRSVECTGRVAWVIQRLDLRETPFLFDVGIEVVDPPPFLRQLLAASGERLNTVKRPPAPRPMESAAIRGRLFVPRLVHEPTRPPRWHLVVSVDGAPCFSARYASERTALLAWTQFQRQQTKRS